MVKTHWKKLENLYYLGSYALLPGQDLIAQIKTVKQEEVYHPSGSKEMCTVAYFTDGTIKPMILNVMNCSIISKLYDTPYIEDWSGKYITVYRAKIKSFGETIETLRVRAKIPTVERIICKECGREITAMYGKTARELADIALNNFNRELCLSCMRKEKAGFPIEN